MDIFEEALRQSLSAVFAILQVAIVSGMCAGINLFFEFKSFKASTKKDLAAAFSKIRDLENKLCKRS